MKYTITQTRVLYVYTISGAKHKGLLKVGEVLVDNEVAEQSEMTLAKEVKDILSQRSYMQGVDYHMVMVQSTIFNDTESYKVQKVHDCLANSGVEVVYLADRNTGDKWFRTDIETVVKAIKAVKEGKKTFNGTDSQVKPVQIVFRPEQRKAINDTVKHFRQKTGKHFLWNAKMRFGKTLSGLQVAKELGYKSTLIITHRPVVDAGWHEDFHKIFGDKSEYRYATRMSDEDSEGDFYQLTKAVDNGTRKLIFFVSMQYLRLSQSVGGKEKHLDKLKRDIMEYNWDFVMVDEAHEGIEAAAGKRVMEKLKKEETRILSLSGTPFNLLDQYEDGEIYTWDYVMEQRAKLDWDDMHYGDLNPYADLPRMQILTFNLNKMVKRGEGSFAFHDFFHVWTADDKESYKRAIENEDNDIRREEMVERLKNYGEGKFIYEPEVKLFLDKLCEESEISQYPFSTDEFIENFRHTFWLVPGVREAAALYDLLYNHEVFGEEAGIFHIVNVAGDGNIEDKDGSALKEVQNAIKNYERTITISCGKLTTGVSVPEWTAVLCMKGSENTPAANYMQTIFRVQTHATLQGRQKSDCYVFDFAPDRALTAVAETAKMAVASQTERKKGQIKHDRKKEEDHLSAFIKLCPVLSMDEGMMGSKISAGQIFEKLSNVYIERAVRSGYADNSLYDPKVLMDLDPNQEAALTDIHGILGATKNNFKPDPINIAGNGLSKNKSAEAIKYIYYLSAEKVVPLRPKMSAESEAADDPMTDMEGWEETMQHVSPIWRYCYISHSEKVDGLWSDFTKPELWKEYKEPTRETDESDEAKRKREEENKEKRARMSVLRGVAIRIPLLVYGAEIDDANGEEITIDNFTSLVDDLSWEEYMPTGFTKKHFNTLKNCFERAIFTGAAKRIRQMVKEADSLNTEDRIAKIATIFSYFHNPDKETVLTPWRVVNMHMSDCLGGWCFWNEEFDDEYTEQDKYGENHHAARFVDRGQVTRDVFGDSNSRILEINSKTGLYPLYMAYSLFKGAKEPEWRKIELTGERGKSHDAEQYEAQAKNDHEIWKDVLQDNIFVVCRTDMAVSITKRTLAGFDTDLRKQMNIKCYKRNISVNGLIKAGIYKATDEGMFKIENTYFYNEKEELEQDLINVLRVKPDLFLQEIVQGKTFWNVYDNIQKSNNEDINNMKFTAIVGNPPYQVMDGGSGKGNSSLPVYQYFVDIAKQLQPKNISMIMPARWYAGGRGLDDFRNTMLTDKHMATLYDYPKARDCFPTVDIAGGLCYFLLDDQQHDLCRVVSVQGGKSNEITRALDEYDVFIRDNIGINIVRKVQAKAEQFCNNYVHSSTPFGLRSFVRGEDLPFEGSVSLYSSDGVSHVERNAITRNADLIDHYKVYIGKINPDRGGVNNAADGMMNVTTKVHVIGPNEIITETYLLLGAYKTYKEALACQQYFKSRLVRFLISLALSSMNIAKETFKFVPVPNCTKTMTEADLYSFYEISNDEAKYIESIVRPM